MRADTYRRYRDAVQGRRMPLAMCDLDRVDRNLDALARRASQPIRLASKSIRCVDILRHVLRHPAFDGLMAFTPSEAAFLVREGFDDILVAYPNVDHSELDLALDAIKQGSTIVFMVDAVDHVRILSERASMHGVRAEVCLDVDLSLSLPGLHFGVRRSPIRNAQDAARLGEFIVAVTNIELVAVMGYEAQIAGVADRQTGRAQTAAVALLKRVSIPQLATRRAATVDRLRAQGHAIRFVNGGGTGSLESTSRERSVTEVSAGSGVYSPTLFDGYSSFQHEPAAFFALPVVRHPAPDIVTCLGGGYIASGAAGDDRLPTPWLPEGLQLLPLEGAGEVQTPLKVPHQLRLAIGDPVFFRHAKAGELCERFDSLALVRGDEVIQEAKTYRGQGECFL